MTEGKWPIGCHDPNSCWRHMRCMYVKCRHEHSETLKDDIRKAEQTELALRALDRANGEIGP